MDRQAVGGLELLVVQSPLEARSGDAYRVDEDGDAITILVVDALGHGGAAADVAAVALAIMAETRRLSLDRIFDLLDRKLTGTRGAAAAIARVSLAEGNVTWAGIGDVQGTIATGPARLTLVGRPGILGYHSPPATPRVVPFGAGDVLCLATDGVLPDFAVDVSTQVGLDVIAGRLEGRMKPDDDSLALLARLEPA
jgi:hypothetical protein